MKRFRTVFLIMTIVSLAAVFSSCGDGDNKSGSVLRITDIDGSGNQDLFFCADQSVEYATADITIRNDSTPNSPTSTNSFVTLNRFRVSYAVLNMSATLPSTNGAGWTAGIDPDGTTTYSGLVLFPEAILQYIRSNYSEIGNGKSMQVRCDIQFWGTDAFGVTVSVTGSLTIEVDDYDPCTTDTEETDESS